MFGNLLFTRTYWQTDRKIWFVTSSYIYIYIYIYISLSDLFLELLCKKIFKESLMVEAKISSIFSEIIVFPAFFRIQVVFLNLRRGHLTFYHYSHLHFTLTPSATGLYGVMSTFDAVE